MPAKTKTEALVGAFFLVGLVIFGIISFKVGDFSSLFYKKMTMTACFSHASGLKEGDGVHVAGVKVGEIEELTLLDDGVQAVMVMDANVKIRESSVATSAWGGLLGTRYIDITLGDPADPLLPPGSDIPTAPSIEIGEVLRKVDTAAMELHDTLKSSNIGPKLSDLIDNLMAISEDIKEQRGTIGKLIRSPELHDKFTEIADDLKDASARIAKLIQDNDERVASILENLDQAVPEARDALAAIKRIGEKIDTGKGILPALIEDEAMYDDLKSALSRLNASLERVDGLTESMREGKGLIARLTNDEALANDFADTIKSLKEITRRLDKGDGTLARLTRDSDMYDDIKKVLDDARETLRSVKEQVPVGTFASVLLSAF